MAKTIKFDLPIDGVTVATLGDLRDHFTTEIIGHFRSGKLAEWLRSRSMDRELAAVERLASSDDDGAATLKELCRIFEVEAGDVVAAAIAKAKEAVKALEAHDAAMLEKLCRIFDVESGDIVVAAIKRARATVEALAPDDAAPLEELNEIVRNFVRWAS